MNEIEIFLATAAVVLPVLTYFAGVQRGKRDRAEDIRRQEGQARAERLRTITETYVANTLKVANMAGALRAGVTSLADWTEVRDFCERVDAAGEPAVIPSVYREKIKDEHLLTFFQLLSKTPSWQTNPDLVSRIIHDLNK